MSAPGYYRHAGRCGAPSGQAATNPLASGCVQLNRGRMRRREIAPRARYARPCNDTPTTPRPPPRPLTPGRGARSPPAREIAHLRLCEPRRRGAT
eukprot:4810171-Prymnesium_polylepis.1